MLPSATDRFLPPLHTSRNYQRPGMIMASSAAIHRDLLDAVQKSIGQS